MRNKLLLMFFGLIGFNGFSQQIPQYSQWSLHQFANNPAHAGIKPCIDVHALYRMQWIGFEGAPKSGFFTMSIPLQAKRKKYLSARHGTGFKFETDQIGQFNINRFNLAYAAHFNFTADNRLSLGLYGGFMQMGYDSKNVHTTEPDPSVSQESSFVAPDASFGAWFNSEFYYFGLTLKNLIPSRWKDIGNTSRNRFHASFNAGYQFRLSENLSLLPSANFRLPPKGPVSLDLNLMFDIKNTVGLGVGYRNTDAVIALVNIKIKEQFSIAYSFDYTLSKIQLGAQNTHELSLRYTSCKPAKKATASCPLFD